MPADFVFKLFMLLSVLNLAVSWLFGLSMLAGNSSPQFFAWDVEAQRKSIHSRMWDPMYRAQKIDPVDGELTVFLHCFYGYGLINMAICRPGDRAFKSAVLPELERLIEISEAAVGKPPFTHCLEIKPPGGVIPAGYPNLLRAGYVMLDGTNARIIADYHRHSREIYDNLTAAPVPFLESYPKMIWPVDNSAALESLRLHDKLFGTSYSGACARWQQWLRTHLDPENGMMISQVSQSGQVLDVPRGCVMSWSLAFMPGFAPELDRQQYPLYKRQMFVPVSGMYGIREWWPGQEKRSVIGAGPVVADIGAAASGLGIAATRANADRECWLGLLRGLELISFPCVNWYGEKCYCGGLFLLGDVMALWAKTTCLWDKPDVEQRLWQSPVSLNGSQSSSFLWVLVVAYVLACSSLIVLAREAFASWRVLRLSPLSTWPASFKIVTAAQCLLALVVFLAPVFWWPYAVFGMLSLRFLEKAIAIKAARGRHESSGKAL